MSNMCDFQASQVLKGNQVHAEIQAGQDRQDLLDQVDEQEVQVFKVVDPDLLLGGVLIDEVSISLK